ncbi:serine/threonine-protein kinase [Pseudolysinimonas sp.]|uniref:serine/threonine-protein kinase n=1 Tax=Pseudolysinimonas sp. TaxID=2680009 RepID=UPI003F7D57D0
MRRVASPPPELPGYEYQRLLGAGGFSDVFLYRQHLPRRQVAVKVLLADELTPAARRAFVDEANLMAQLSAHPFIVTIHSADITPDERPYFVMEYCAGPSLSEQYKRQRFSVVDALRTGVRLSSAVATAHAAGILHRDIKPANVLTNEYGWPALTDFGISSAVDELPVHTTTSGMLRGEETGATGQSVGMSVPWSPPEMFEDDPDPDVRSDVFSLAATIWTLLAARTPFEVPGRPNGTLDLIGRIERGAITPMDRDDVPASLIAVLTRGMAVRRADRYQSAVDFARALQRVELELGYAPTGIELPSAGGSDDDEPAPPSDDAPETRLGGVSVIAAQPIAPQPVIVPPVAVPPAAGVAADLPETRVRGVATVAAQPPAASSASAPVLEQTVLHPRRSEPAPSSAPAEPAAEPAMDPGSPRRRPRPAALIAVGGLVVVAVAVAVSIGVTAGRPQPQPSPTGSGSSAVIGGAPQAPKFLSAQPSADGTSVTFTFAPVPNAAGYQWAPAEDPESRTGVKDPVVVRTGVTPGQRVCVRLNTIAPDGRTSEPTTGCSA